MRHVLSARQFNPDAMGELFEQASSFRADLVGNPSAKRALAGRYAGEVLLNIFYEPSTRTRVSFGLAARKLGMQVEGTENAREFSSASKGETLEDTIRVLGEYDPAVIVLRHNETGAAERAATVSEAPIVNAGDGKGEHPSQALLDAYTIQEQLGRLDNLHVVMGGDLAHGRTVRSLAQMLSMYPGNSITFVSTPELQIGDDIKGHLRYAGTNYTETDDVMAAVQDADVVYWTRLQKERIEGDLIAAQFEIGQDTLQVMPDHTVIMHPLPRVGEIHGSVDTDPRAKYFRQAGNGLYVRMALIDMVMKS